MIFKYMAPYLGQEGNRRAWTGIRRVGITYAIWLRLICIQKEEIWL